MKTISLKLPDDLDKELTTRAEHRQTTKSALIREAIKEYLAQTPGPRKGSFLELAGDLIGSVEGPGDLSYNKESLKSYGDDDDSSTLSDPGAGNNDSGVRG
jgi:hypothetical protein